MRFTKSDIPQWMKDMQPLRPRDNAQAEAEAQQKIAVQRLMEAEIPKFFECLLASFNQQEIIQSLGAEIAKLQRVIDLLNDKLIVAEQVRRPGRPKESGTKATSFNPGEFAPRSAPCRRKERRGLPRHKRNVGLRGSGLLEAALLGVKRHRRSG